MQALKTLSEGLQEYTQDQRVISRDGCIQRFEYCYELFWKTLKDALEEYHAITVAGAKSAFTEAHRAMLITDTELPALLELISLRNLTVHTYNEATAEMIAEKLPGCLALMQAIALRLNQ